MKRFLLMMFVLCASAGLAAQIEVVKGGRAKYAIDLTTFTASGEAGRTFRAVLEADLKRSGYFTIGAPGAAAFVLSGSASDELSVRCSLLKSGAPLPLKGGYRSDAKGARKLAHQVADEIIEAVTGKPGMNRGRIALIGKVNGRKELFAADCDGANLRQITSDKSISVGPYISADGRKVAYTSFVKNFAGVYVIDLLEGRRKAVANFPGSNLSGGISPDGGHLAMVLSKDGNPELYVGSVSGGGLTRLTHTPRSEASPCWSPDGRQIAYVSDQGGSPRIYVMDRSGGAAKRLSSGGSQNVAPDWGPNGWIVYSSAIGGKFQICMVHAVSGETVQITQDGYDYEDPTWAPDGRHILCARSSNYRSELVLVDTLGDPPFPLTLPKGDWYSPSWSRE